MGIANEVPAADIKKAFEDDGTKIFSARRAPQTSAGKIFDVLRCVFKPKYNSIALRKTITDIIGAETTIGDIKHPCIIPTVCLTKGGPQIFKTDHHADFGSDHRVKVSTSLWRPPRLQPIFLSPRSATGCMRTAVSLPIPPI